MSPDVFFQWSEVSHFTTISPESCSCAIASLPSGRVYKCGGGPASSYVYKNFKNWGYLSLDMVTKRITCKVCKADLASYIFYR